MSSEPFSGIALSDAWEDLCAASSTSLWATTAGGLSIRFARRGVEKGYVFAGSTPVQEGVGCYGVSGLDFRL